MYGRGKRVLRNNEYEEKMKLGKQIEPKEYKRFYPSSEYIKKAVAQYIDRGGVIKILPTPKQWEKQDVASYMSKNYKNMS